jgi:hypothetical protein
MFTESKSDFIDDDDFGEEVTFYASGTGSGSTIIVVVDDDFPNQQIYERGMSFATAVLHAHSDDISSPNSKDTFTFHGYNWEVSEDGIQRSGDFWRYNLVRLLG